MGRYVGRPIIMVVLLGGVRLGAIAMVPNLLPIVVIMGVMGVSNIPIDMSTILISSISIGVAVDDTIHLLHHYRVNLAATGNVETSIQRAMSHSGRAMVTTSLILVLGFAAYLAASVANFQRFGLLVIITCGESLFAAVAILQQSDSVKKMLVACLSVYYALLIKLLYFELQSCVAKHAINVNALRSIMWTLAHLPLYISAAGAGAVLGGMRRRILIPTCRESLSPSSAGNPLERGRFSFQPRPPFESYRHPSTPWR